MATSIPSLAIVHGYSRAAAGVRKRSSAGLGASSTAGGGFFNMLRIDRVSRRGVVVMGKATSYDHERVAATALAGGDARRRRGRPMPGW